MDLSSLLLSPLWPDAVMGFPGDTRGGRRRELVGWSGRGLLLSSASFWPRYYFLLLLLHLSCYEGGKHGAAAPLLGGGEAPDGAVEEEPCFLPETRNAPAPSGRGPWGSGSTSGLCPRAQQGAKQVLGTGGPSEGDCSLACARRAVGRARRRPRAREAMAAPPRHLGPAGERGREPPSVLHNAGGQDGE